MPELSIIVVTFNAAETLPETLASIQRQEGLSPGEVEVVVVDGASTDGTIEMVKASRVADLVLSEADAGIYDAMNKGVRLASGRLVQYLNAGDWLARTDSLRTVLDAAAAHPEALWIVAGATNHAGGDRSVMRIPNLPHVWWKHALGLRPHCHQACWFDRALFLAMGAFRLDFGTAADFDQVLRFGLLGRPLEIDEVLVGYLGGGVSDRNPRETPALLERIRRDRFGLGPVTGRLITLVVTVVNFVRMSGGRIRTKWTN